MNKDEALRLALDAMEDCQLSKTNAAIQACEEALAQPEPEPFAFFHPHKGFYFAKPTSVSAPTIIDFEPVALYTTPQPEREWVGLTDEEIGKLYRDGWSNNMEFARAIEDKLRRRTND